MDSRERYNALIQRDFKSLDRIPQDFWASNDVIARLSKYYHVQDKEEVLDLLDIDFRYIDGPKYIGPPLKTYSDGSQNDLWGVPRKKVTYGEGEFQGTYMNVVDNPLKDAKSIKEIEAYEYWPDPNWFDYSVIAEQCKNVHSKGRVVVFMGDRLNRIAQLKPTMYLRGVEKTLADLARKESPIFDGILGKITDFYTQYLKNILNAAQGKIDILATGDDFGQQHGLLCRPKTWREKLQPGFKHYINTAKALDPKIKVMHHTCGSVYPIIEDMIRSGLDILNPIQPGTYMMEAARLKKEFGNDILFHGGISLQGPLRFGNPKEIFDEVRRASHVLGDKGGYIICTAHNLNADIKTENIAALFDAYKEFTPVHTL